MLYVDVSCLVGVIKQEARLPQRKRASNIALSYGAKHFHILNRLGVNHECERQTNGRTDGQAAVNRAL